jgi:glycosyltransferase involved in cell wall biosynthesis
MKIGIAIEETWDFFNEIYADLSGYHQTSLFERKVINLPVFNDRTNRYLFARNLSNFLQSNDVVFFEWASELLVAATHMPKVCGIVTRLHRYEMYQWVDQVDWEAVDRIILVSKAKEREFGNLFPEQASKVAVIPEAISLQKYQFRPKPFKGDIGILCNLSPRKRVYELVLGFYDLVQARDDFHLHIGGGKHPKFREYSGILHSLVEKLNLQDKVTFYDRVSDPQEWYHRIDIFISNSYSEGLQVSSIEAMASGCYCLSHRWDGAEELLPEENLFYTNGQMAEKILHYSELPEMEKQEILVGLRSKVEERFDVDKTKVLIRKVLEQIGATRNMDKAQSRRGLGS